MSLKYLVHLDNNWAYAFSQLWLFYVFYFEKPRKLCALSLFDSSLDSFACIPPLRLLPGRQRQKKGGEKTHYYSQPCWIFMNHGIASRWMHEATEYSPVQAISADF